MEKGVMDFMAGLRESFGLEEVDIRTYSPLVLAYIGDVVLDYMKGLLI